jgi:enoyl-CoA hydratase/carnithine racemase
MYPGEMAYAAGFLAELAEDLDAAVRQTVDRLLGHAPLTMWAAKEANRRLRRAATAGIDGDDIVGRVYGSDDFHAGVRAFSAKQKRAWTGR